MFFGIDLHKLLNWTYLTQIPPLIFAYDREVLFFLIASFLIAIALFFLSRKKLNYIRPNRILFRTISLYLILTDLYGVLVYVSRIQGLPFFSMRIMMFIWYLSLLIGLFILLFFLTVKYPKILRAYYKEQLRRQYLPK